MRGISLYLLPIVGVAAGLFGLLYVWSGANTLLHHQWGPGVLLTMFGLAGVALNAALLNAWRQFVRRARGAAN